MPPRGCRGRRQRAGLPGCGVRQRGQLPVGLPVDVRGNSVNMVGVGNPAPGNESTNTSEEAPGRPAEPAPEPAAPPRTLPAPGPEAHAAAPAAPAGSGALAETGGDQTFPVLATGVALFPGGTALYRRSRPGAEAGAGAQA
ncbi:chaplin [Streptomyces hirsutus]|uniref:chaplin n=1 Tax=Streptomyces hirsutus TaxID=35620 RepID=UPI00342B664D